MAPVVFVEEPTELLDTTPCGTCAGVGRIDCAEDRRAKSCSDPECELHVHDCINCRGSGLRRDCWMRDDR